jgi:hypothetical protein
MPVLSHSRAKATFASWHEQGPGAEALEKHATLLLLMPKGMSPAKFILAARMPLPYQKILM